MRRDLGTAARGGVALPARIRWEPMRTKPGMIGRSFGLLGVALLLQAGTAAAAPLDEEDCDKLKAEQTQLEGAGARADMTKGPEWAKTNLTPDKLGQVKRLIEVEELLMFRCGSGSRLVMPADTDEDDDDNKKDDDKAPPSKGGTKSAKAADNKATDNKGAGKKAGAPAKAAKAKQAAPDAKK